MKRTSPPRDWAKEARREYHNVRFHLEMVRDPSHPLSQGRSSLAIRESARDARRRAREARP